MARNASKGPGRRGSVRQQSQLLNPKTRRWTKRDDGTGRFMEVKEDEEFVLTRHPVGDGSTIKG
jgi:hypothetical protein